MNIKCYEIKAKLMKNKLSLDWLVNMLNVYNVAVTKRELQSICNDMKDYKKTNRKVRANEVIRKSLEIIDKYEEKSLEKVDF